MFLGFLTLMAEQYDWGGGYTGGVLALKAVLAIASALLLPLIAKRVKPVASFSTHIALMLLVTLGLAVLQASPILWSFLYILTIISTSFFFVHMETIIMMDIPERYRARAFSLYWLVAIAGYAIGPMIVKESGLAMWGFGGTAVFFISSYILLFKRRWMDSKHLSAIKATSFVKIVLKYPFVWGVCIASGVNGETVAALIGVMSFKVGLSADQGLGLISYFLWGGVVTQYMAGWLIDHLGVKRMAFYMPVVVILIGGLVLLSMGGYSIMVMSIAIWGAACFGASLLSLSLISTLTKNNENGLLMISVHMVFYDMGSVVGNAVNGISLDVFSGNGLVYSVSGFSVFMFISAWLHYRKHLPEDRVATI